ncbi:hypothetical protein BM43_4134 [Burkholderia gladioli]|nr:hypothetical protein BM43_4134 [Burkholderia gladioli]
MSQLDCHCQAGRARPHNQYARFSQLTHGSVSFYPFLNHVLLHRRDFHAIHKDGKIVEVISELNRCQW